ncbi:addiction module protein [Phenylobacterium aquaticum]|uniref:addiction module protein n=1 Tax=Phenylobacterium aquaticum TaxID=1763816 RepID=UPI0026F15D36|nr:addiction module protein [Phenylobacterium aquaticum]
MKNKPSTFRSCRGFQMAHNLVAMKTLTRDEIGRLSPTERLILIGDLWDSLDGASSPLPESQRLELDRRLANLDQDLGEAVTWDRLSFAP